MAIESYSFTAVSQDSGEIKAKDGNLIALSLVFGGASATIDLERKIGGGDWAVLEQYTADVEKNIEAVSRQCAYRCSTSAWSSGTIELNMATP